MTPDDVLGFELIRLNGVVLTVGTLLTAFLIVGAGWVLSALAQRAIRRAWEQRAARDQGNMHAILRLGHYSIMLVSFGVAFETLGVNLTTLFAAGAIFAIGLGFAMQNIAQNFVSGVILLVERTIRPGDLLEVNGVLVRVQELGLRATLVRTRFEEEMIVPNSLLVQSTIKNFTLHDPLYRVRTVVGVSYSSDLRVVPATLEATARAVGTRYEGRDPVVLLSGFGSSSVDYEVSVWTDDPWNERKLLSRLNDAIWWALKDAGVTIAFPQSDVHLDREVVDALRGHFRNEPAAVAALPGSAATG
jgi:potassium-dependent mechanosensitive channel